MRRVLIIITLCVVVLFAGIFSYLSINTKAVSADKTNIMFIVKSGDSLVNISQKLKSNSLIRNQYSFLFYAYTLGLNNKIQAGTFRLSPSLSTQDLITKLSKGGVSDYWLKIIEGTRLEEIIALLPSKIPLSTKEGSLFPDSYLIPTYFTIDQTLEVIKENFDKKFAQAKEGATNLKLTDQEILIFASILEREARTLKSKQEVAGILLNRLEIGMALQVDASVQYARDSKTKPKDYWQPIKPADLSIVSPFNTYKNPGLPPAPICNPGYNSLYAAFHPVNSDYLYYITGHDNLMHYATTLDEHNANIAKYLN
jgi:UPF0755 protein